MAETRADMIRRIRQENVDRLAEQMKSWTDRELALYNQLQEAENIIVQAQDALGVDHPVWWLLDDYDGSGDSTKRDRQFHEGAMELLTEMYEVIGESPALQGHGADLNRRIKVMEKFDRFVTWWRGKGGYIHPTIKGD